MITIQAMKQEGKPTIYCPVFLCDVCGQRIADAQLALYKWEDDENKHPKSGSFVMVHKGTCDKAHNARENATSWPWEEFTTLLGLLINNAQARRDDAIALWPYLIEHYCPTELLEEVQRKAQHLIDYPDDRPPSINDLSL